MEEVEKVGLNMIEYFDLYNEIKGMVGDRDVAMVILQEFAKDIRATQLKERRLQKLKGPATAQQKAWMKKLHIDFGPEITYGQAKALLEGEMRRAA